MQIIESTSFRQERGLAATIGFFDGVHIGHRSLLSDVRATAAAKGLASGIITFREHPKKVLTGESMPLITSTEERLARLAATGIDYCVLLDFTPELARLSARDFIALMRDRYRLLHLTIGYDHRFGHNRNDTPDDYRRYGEALGVEVSQSEAYRVEGHKASSSEIRRMLTEGRVQVATLLLADLYRLQGRVVSGRQVGRSIGFPTANIEPSCPDKIIPADGAYAVRAYRADGAMYGGMLNIGTRPSVTPESRKKSIEVHLFNYSGSLYGEHLCIEFVAYLRPERRMESLEALRRQLEQDRARCLEIL